MISLSHRDDRPHSLTRTLAVALIYGVIPLSVTACGDATDPENVAPIHVVNDTSDTVAISWCSGDDSSCKERRKLGFLQPTKEVSYKISSYEIVFRLETAGVVKYLCQDDAEGSRVKISNSFSNLNTAYKKCGGGPKH